jgi:hypothetical protein
MIIELINDLDARIAEAKRSGRTGDWEVIEALVQVKGVRWRRRDSGKLVKLPVDSMRAAVKCGFEMRPRPREAVGERHQMVGLARLNTGRERREMSRKSDIEMAIDAAVNDGWWMDTVASAAYDLGRAAQAATDSGKMAKFEHMVAAQNLFKRLRAKVRKMAEGGTK